MNIIKEERIKKKISIKAMSKGMNIPLALCIKMEENYTSCNAFLIYQACVFLGLDFNNIT